MCNQILPEMHSVLILCIVLCLRQFAPGIMRKEHIHDLPIILISWLNSEYVAAYLFPVESNFRSLIL